jgi:hypothetical protein
MQANRFDRLGDKVSFQPSRAQIFVVIINPLPGRIIRQVMEQMTDVMQQGGHHGGRVQSGLPGQKGPLKGVLALGDRLAAVL